ncbi:amino acid ABC transporter permease [Erysipelothrix inopinata]|uniref:Amino acid ABC transporter permease n=1 Tax=Erysipelothrix inopinata TaxID=225084 RepID=A0A7G9RZV1_9FIRM|nr:amino acid ABC transporter permease [Erysipelothrix inopinata]QNN61126.1 amino acid ABC transporter permease [Erysipelothrix inopinata]
MLNDIINLWAKYHQVYIEGVIGTLWMSLIVVVLGTLLGAILALGQRSRFKVIRGIVNCYVEIFRGTPLLLQMWLFVYGGALYTGNTFDETFWVICALIVNSSAYVTEIFRAGLQAVDKGQFEAAQSLGMSRSNMMRKIILPQAIKNILPALGNEFVTMIKETSIASVFFVTSLMTSQSIVNSATHLSIASLIIVGSLYFVLTFISSRLVKFAERKLIEND